MIEVSLKDAETLHLDVRGWSVILGLRRSLDIPLHCIQGVQAGPAGLPGVRFGDIRTLGTSVPRLVAVGSFWMGKSWERVFLDLRRSSKEVLVLELRGWRYDRVIVEVRDAKSAVRMVEEGRKQRKPALR